MVFEENFLRLTVTVRFQKIKKIKKNVNFLILFFSQLVMVVTKQIYCSPAF